MTELPKYFRYGDGPKLDGFVIENVIFSKGVNADDHSDVLTLVAADGRELECALEGDCCSSSYFSDESRLDARALVGQQLRSAEVVDCGEDPSQGPDDYGRTLLYVLKLTTDKESISVDWRNDSNGYYSGICEFELRMGPRPPPAPPPPPTKSAPLDFAAMNGSLKRIYGDGK